MTAIRLCLDRIAPPRKDYPITFALPPIGSPGDAVAAILAIISGVAEGEITPGEAEQLSKLVDVYARTLLASELEARVAQLEKAK